MLHHHRKRFLYALRGIGVVVREEASFRIQLVAFAVVIVLGMILEVDSWKWVILILVSASVLLLECVNSAVERLVDAVEPRLHHLVADIKDILAGAVFIMSLAAVVIGCIIFLPYVASL